MKSNMYEYTLNQTWDSFAEYASGEQAALIAIVSSKPLGETAVSALQSSFFQLGYGKSSCTFIALHGKANSKDANGSQNEKAHGDITQKLPSKESSSQDLSVLTGKELFSLIEGFDPLFLVVCDKEAVEALAQSYRQDIPLDKRSRLFGREVRAFTSFEDMLDDAGTKQKAWALLKSLPRLES